MAENFNPSHGGHKAQLSCKKAEIVFDGTIEFANDFSRICDRVVNQMVQAARPGKENIVDGNQPSGTS